MHIKKQLITAALILTMACIPAAALAVESHTFSLATVDDSGVTRYDALGGVTTATNQTLSDSGVSLMARRSGVVPADLKSDPYAIDISESSGLYQVRLTTADTSQTSSIHYNDSGLTDFSSAVTEGFYVKIAPENTAGAWSAADLIPIWTNRALNSSVSPWPEWVQLPLGNFMRAYFLPSGVTPFGEAVVEISSGYEAAMKDQFAPPIIQTLIYSLNANSGTSTTATDDNGTALSAAASYGEMQVISPSGNSVFYTRNQAAIDTATANTLEHTDTRDLNRFELQNLSMEALGAATVRIDCFATKP